MYMDTVVIVINSNSVFHEKETLLVIKCNISQSFIHTILHCTDLGMNIDLQFKCICH